jgi:hypothetical protein
VSDRFLKTLRTLTGMGRCDEDVCKRLGRQQGLFWRLLQGRSHGKLNWSTEGKGPDCPHRLDHALGCVRREATCA